MTSPLDHPIAVTFFPTFAAATKREEAFTPRSLASRILSTTASQKARLPWLKLARFGDKRTNANCLRNDENVLTITGIEADYDAGKMPFAEAQARLEQQGIASCLYTSPSHTDAAPRWRVLCPLSAEMPPDRRRPLLGRLNGLFNGIFSRESFVLSQSFYYGSVLHNPAHRVVLIDGSPIDQHDDLDAIWVGPSNNPATPGDAAATGDERDSAELVRRICTGEEFHTALGPLAARMIGRNVPPAIVAEFLRGLMLARPPETKDARWHQRYGEIDRLVESAHRRFGASAEQRRAASKVLARAACRLIRAGVPDADVLRQMAEINSTLAPNFDDDQISNIAVWAARTAGGAHV